MKRLVLALALLVGALPSHAQHRVPYRSPELAAAKSVILPGWGQFSNGDSNRGTALFAVGAIGVLLGSHTIGVADTPRRIETERGLGWMLYGLSMLWGAFDAYNRASDINHENGYDVGRVQVGWDEGGVNLRVTLLQLGFGGS